MGSSLHCHDAILLQAQTQCNFDEQMIHNYQQHLLICLRFPQYLDLLVVWLQKSQTNFPKMVVIRKNITNKDKQKNMGPIVLMTPPGLSWSTTARSPHLRCCDRCCEASPSCAAFWALPGGSCVVWGPVVWDSRGTP